MASMPDTLGRRHSGDADTWITCRYEVYTNSVIAMLLGDIGHKADGTFAGHRPQFASKIHYKKSCEYCQGC